MEEGMKYRTFRKTGERVSLLGFGCMRLPVVGGDMHKIDEPEAIAMIRKAIDSGVNYVDTAYPYHGGASEAVVGKALKDGYRDRTLLADKYPIWLTQSEAGAYELFEEQLRRLDVESIDMYMLHNINKGSWEATRKYNIIKLLEKKLAEGRIKNLGFSFHDELPLFKEVADAYPWDFCQIQLNFMDVRFQAGVEGMRYAASKGIPVVVMEPLKGGKLTDSIPAAVSELWGRAEVKRSAAEWALRWVADFPEVLTILSGMSNMRQVEENLAILSGADANSLTEKEKRLIGEVADTYNRLTPYSCTNCRYCMPCQSGVNIPEVVNYRNEWELYEHNEKISNAFRMFLPQEQYPSRCVKCAACEEKCPQRLPVMKVMDETAAIFEAPAGA
jgi:predicted aldo/keto reductase-like oxidoreductase